MECGMNQQQLAVVQQVIDALFARHPFTYSEEITALRQLLEQPEPVQEPDAVVTGYYGGQCVVTPTNPARVFNTGTVFYTQPTDHSEQHLDMVDHGDELTIAYLDGVHTGKQIAKREWADLEEIDFVGINQSCTTKMQAAAAAARLLKEKNT
jgi:hypothetical protein